MITYPNAKINLGLNIISKRTDGYHNLESVFYPVSLKDSLEINRAESFSYTSSGITIDSKPVNNLVVKAYQLLRDKFQLPPIAIHLHKNIPPGSGLGGGSSDASFCLMALNDLFQLNLSKTVLADLSRELGADCPFFIYNEPAFVSGIGEVIKPFGLNLSGLVLVMVKPEISVPTAIAFQQIVPKKPDVPICTILNNDPEVWRGQLFNDFEPAIFKRYPEIGQIKDILYQQGALYASMSGSGSTVYGLFKNPPQLDQRFKDCFYFVRKL